MEDGKSRIGVRNRTKGGLFRNLLHLAGALLFLSFLLLLFLLFWVYALLLQLTYDFLPVENTLRNIRMQGLTLQAPVQNPLRRGRSQHLSLPLQLEVVK